MHKALAHWDLGLPLESRGGFALLAEVIFLRTISRSSTRRGGGMLCVGVFLPTSTLRAFWFWERMVT